MSSLNEKIHTESETEKNLANTSESKPDSQSIATAFEETYDCCICRLSSASNSDRPIGAVTLLQATSGILHLSHY